MYYFVVVLFSAFYFSLSLSLTHSLTHSLTLLHALRRQQTYIYGVIDVAYFANNATTEKREDMKILINKIKSHKNKNSFTNKIFRTND